MQTTRNVIVTLLTDKNYGEALGTALSNLGFKKNEDRKEAKEKRWEDAQAKKQTYCKHCKKRAWHTEDKCRNNPENEEK